MPAYEANAILAINSTDRYYGVINGRADQPYTNTLESEFQNAKPFSNDFSITAPSALINGYINKIVVTQIQLQYNLPTIQPNNNDAMFVVVETTPGSGVPDIVPLQFPYGFYTPSELATMLQVQLNAQTVPPPPGIQGNEFTVIYSQGEPSTLGSVDYNPYPPGYFSFVGFTILSNYNRRIYIPNTIQLAQAGLPQEEINVFLKTCRLFGFNILNIFPALSQRSRTIPVFLYTPYIDIYSDALTNYQRLKDTNTSISRRKGLVSRIYLSGTGNIQSTLPNTSLGCAPFIATYDLNNPKVIGWSPDTAVNSLDFQLRDCYDELLFTYSPINTAAGGVETSEVFNTEFQMTLLCIEGD